MTFHTCICHFVMWWNKSWKITHITITFTMMGGGKVVKRARIWVPWKGHWLYSSFHLPAIITRSSTHAVIMGWERILPLKIDNNFKSWKQIVILIWNVVIAISRHVENHCNFTHVLHSYNIARVNINMYVDSNPMFYIPREVGLLRSTNHLRLIYLIEQGKLYPTKSRWQEKNELLCYLYMCESLN